MLVLLPSPSVTVRLTVRVAAVGLSPAFTYATWRAIACTMSGVALAFKVNVSAALLGLPLAPPGRRFAAMAIDLLVVAMVGVGVAEIVAARH